MLTLLLRPMRAQMPTSDWKDDDYAVLHDEQVIGRIYRISGGPQGNKWRWTLNHIKFFQSKRDGILLSAVAETLDAAKVEIKGEYEAWLAAQ